MNGATTPFYTMILSKGTHLVTAADAVAILGAIDEGRRTIEISLDPFGGGQDRRTTIVLAHVVLLTPNPEEQSRDESRAHIDHLKVTTLRRAHMATGSPR